MSKVWLDSQIYFLRCECRYCNCSFHSNGTDEYICRCSALSCLGTSLVRYNIRSRRVHQQGSRCTAGFSTLRSDIKRWNLVVRSSTTERFNSFRNWHSHHYIWSKIRLFLFYTYNGTYWNISSPFVRPEEYGFHHWSGEIAKNFSWRQICSSSFHGSSWWYYVKL